MINFKRDVYEQTNTTNEEGRVKKSFSKTRTIRTGAIIPNTMTNNSKNFGENKEFSFSVWTVDEININEVIEIHSSFYSVKQVLLFPNQIKQVLMDLISL